MSSQSYEQSISILRYIQERPGRSIIIINITVIVVVIIVYSCYRIIVIPCPHYLCVVWLVSITQPKKRLVQLCVLCGWHYQNKSYPAVLIDCDSSIIICHFLKTVFKFSFEKLFKIVLKSLLKYSLSIYCFIFFVTTTTILTPPPPPPYWNPKIYSYFEKGCRTKCTRQSRKVLWVVLNSLFFKEV